MKEILGSLLVFLFYVLIVVFMNIRNHRKSSWRVRFTLNFLYKVLLYIGEVFFIFVIYLLFLKIVGYVSKEEFLKQFLDFFAVYQIFIFAVLNLYDSLKKEIPLSLLHQIERVQPYLDANMRIDEELEAIPNRFSHDRRMKYDDIDLSKHEDLTLLIKFLKSYNENIENEKVVNKEKFNIILLKNNLNEEKERLESLWNISLCIRIFNKIFPSTKKS